MRKFSSLSEHETCILMSSHKWELKSRSKPLIFLRDEWKKLQTRQGQVHVFLWGISFDTYRHCTYKRENIFLTLRELQFKSVNKKHRQATIFNKIAIFQIENLLFIVPHMSLDSNHFTIFLFLSYFSCLSLQFIYYLMETSLLSIYYYLYTYRYVQIKNKDETGFNFFLCYFYDRCTVALSLN